MWRKIFVLIIAFLLTTSVASAAEYTFNTNLRLGDSNTDVLFLQKVLNQDINTRVAVSGPGSPGNETMYFGPLTKSAVIRFQNIHKNEVLLPIGLQYGTGFVGSMTRAKLNKTSITSDNITEKENVVVEKEPVLTLPVINTVSPNPIGYGDTVTLKGTGFTDDNIIFTSLGPHERQANDDGTEIIFIMISSPEFGPENVPDFPGIIQVVNKNGFSSPKNVMYTLD